MKIKVFIIKFFRTIFYASFNWMKTHFTGGIKNAMSCFMKYAAFLTFLAIFWQGYLMKQQLGVMQKQFEMTVPKIKIEIFGIFSDVDGYFDISGDVEKSLLKTKKELKDYLEKIRDIEERDFFSINDLEESKKTSQEKEYVWTEFVKKMKEGNSQLDGRPTLIFRVALENPTNARIKVRRIYCSIKESKDFWYPEVWWAAEKIEEVFSTPIASESDGLVYRRIPLNFYLEPNDLRTFDFTFKSDIFNGKGVDRLCSDEKDVLKKFSHFARLIDQRRGLGIKFGLNEVKEEVFLKNKTDRIVWPTFFKEEKAWWP